MGLARREPAQGKPSLPANDFAQQPPEADENARLEQRGGKSEQGSGGHKQCFGSEACHQMGGQKGA